MTQQTIEAMAAAMRFNRAVRRGVSGVSSGPSRGQQEKQQCLINTSPIAGVGDSLKILNQWLAEDRGRQLIRRTGKQVNRLAPGPLLKTRNRKLNQL